MSPNCTATTARSDSESVPLMAASTLGSVDEGHLHLGGILNHVIVGHNEKLRVILPHDDAGAAGLRLVGLGPKKKLLLS